MPTPVFTNNAVGVLAAAYTPDATALTLAGGQGGKFPSPGVDQFFPVTLVNVANEIEIVWCTSRTGDTLTVTRGQEGTAARALATGEKAEHRLTAGAIAAVLTAPLTAGQIPNGFITGPMIAGIGSPSGAAITTGKIALGAVGSQQLSSLRFIHETQLDVGVAEASLGFKPVKQVGAVEVALGWVDATKKMPLTIGGDAKGNVLYEVSDGTVNSAGYRGLVTNVHDENYVLGLVDNGRQVLHTAGNHTYTVPADATAAILIGGVIKIVNRGGAINIVGAPGVTLTWLPNNVAGGRILGAPGTCVLEKMDGSNWWVYGMGLT